MEDNGMKIGTIVAISVNPEIRDMWSVAMADGNVFYIDSNDGIRDLVDVFGKAEVKKTFDGEGSLDLIYEHNEMGMLIHFWANPEEGLCFDDEV